MTDDVLARIDAFLDRTVRDSTDAVDVGVLRALLSRRPWPDSARPIPALALSGPEAVTVDDLRAAAAVLEEAGAPVAFEWIAARVPSMAAAVEAYGFGATTSPLQAMTPGPGPVYVADGVPLRLLGAGDPATPEAARVVAESFSSPFVEDPDDIDARIREGRSHVCVAEADGRIVSVCSLNPIDGVGEVLGGGTLPAYRRRGIGKAVVSRLVVLAHELDLDIVFESASDDGVSVWESIGFRTVGTLCESPPD